MVASFGNLTNPKNLALINEKNKELQNMFLDYLLSKGRAHKTIKAYTSGLNLFFSWNMVFNDNKDFVKITKEDFKKYVATGLTDWEWSMPTAHLYWAALHSLAEYVQVELDNVEEYAGYKSVIAKVTRLSAPQSARTVKLSSEDAKLVFDELMRACDYKAVCVFALMLYSGQKFKDLNQYKISDFNDKYVIDGIVYKSPKMIMTQRHGKDVPMYFYVLKKQFDPYLNLWLRYRDEAGIKTEWLFPDHRVTGKCISLDYFRRLRKKIAKILGKDDFSWQSIRKLAREEFIKANLSKDVIQDMVGWDVNDGSLLCSNVNTSESMEEYFKR